MEFMCSAARFRRPFSRHRYPQCVSDALEWAQFVVRGGAWRMVVEEMGVVLRSGAELMVGG